MSLVRGFCFWNRMFRKHPLSLSTHVRSLSLLAGFFLDCISWKYTTRCWVLDRVLSLCHPLFHVRLMNISSCNCSSLDYHSVGVCAGVCICKKTHSSVHFFFQFLLSYNNWFFFRSPVVTRCVHKSQGGGCLVIQRTHWLFLALSGQSLDPPQALFNNVGHETH